MRKSTCLPTSQRCKDVPNKRFYPTSSVNGPTARLSGEQPAPPKPRLLLVEDEPAEWMFLFEVLQAHYDVEVATNGYIAWEIAQLHPPDIVLSDVIMPGMDGFTLARHLRKYTPTAKVPIVLLSASSKIELMVRGLVAGADDVLLKPIQMDELLANLRARLDAVSNEAGEARE